MSNLLEGRLNAAGKRFGFVAARFNNLVVQKLVEGATDCIVRHGGEENDIDVAWVPGAFEIPIAAQKMAHSGKYDAVICLGAVIRGATPHFEYIAAEVTKGIAQINLQTGFPTIYGIITADTLEQALERAGTKMGNKGWDAALSAIEMIDLLPQIEGK
ncbi:6,7-dimethyl-8-ribityllumazine synthase [bacterium BMS3Abin05]|nr:6,7-dimethyl-8-ribityllumazine synthase [bacterium BMS3Abin05]GBE27751.1 6,7-dimethyl-8-ribityllumazine synthase [bacterium BMS3Bbin03]HDK35504.1 6,7-dimethyl-8-ribityllumazine synthase [Bacteroidota bacterium]HDZ10777.1 6,7-dimethyl-8-ribityllumazine synthase [Bacteroidota bacterium]